MLQYTNSTIYIRRKKIEKLILVECTRVRDRYRSRPYILTHEKQIRLIGSSPDRPGHLFSNQLAKAMGLLPLFYFHLYIVYLSTIRCNKCVFNMPKLTK